MAVRSLQALILILVAVAGFEIGTLHRPRPPAPRAVFIDTGPVELAACPSPLAADPEPAADLEPDAALAVQPPPAPRPRPKHPRATAAGPIPGARSVADCAQNGGPLCGMPE